MLNLSLHKNDYIMVGDNIRIQFAPRKSTSTTFAIAVGAPREVKITHHRIEDASPEVIETHKRRAELRRTSQAKHS